LRLLIETSRHKSIQPIGDGGGEKDPERPGKSLVIKSCDKNGYQYETKNCKEIGNSQNR